MHSIPGESHALADTHALCRYDSNNLVTEPYDWRLPTPLLEKRDGYFTRLRDRIKSLYNVHQLKVPGLCLRLRLNLVQVIPEPEERRQSASGRRHVDHAKLDRSCCSQQSTTLLQLPLGYGGGSLYDSMTCDAYETRSMGSKGRLEGTQSVW